MLKVYKLVQCELVSSEIGDYSTYYMIKFRVKVGIADYSMNE
jgi:hypothetical protein